MVGESRHTMATDVGELEGSDGVCLGGCCWVWLMEIAGCVVVQVKKDSLRSTRRIVLMVV